METPAGADMVGAWWRQWPGANIGVVTGRVSGLSVVDVDPRHGGDDALADLELQSQAIPTTLESRTGGGGRHIWFAAPREELSTVDLAAGVELKAERGLVVAPPSAHASGGTYQWLDWSQVPVALPGWLTKLALGSHSSSRRSLHGPPRTHREQEEFRLAWERAGVELRAGDEYYLCPFHDDHHPSLHVDAEGCRWYCFACQMGGGIGRLQRVLGEDRPTRALNRLEGRVGPDLEVTLSGEDPVEVVGESFHQDELLRVTGGRRHFGGVDVETVAELVPIEGNGIEVLVGDSEIGYLSRSDGDRLRSVVEESVHRLGIASCRASIRGGWDRGGDDVGLFGVTLWLEEP